MKAKETKSAFSSLIKVTICILTYIIVNQVFDPLRNNSLGQNAQYPTFFLILIAEHVLIEPKYACTLHMLSQLWNRAWNLWEFSAFWFHISWYDFRQNKF